MRKIIGQDQAGIVILEPINFINQKHSLENWVKIRNEIVNERLDINFDYFRNHIYEERLYDEMETCVIFENKEGGRIMSQYYMYKGKIHKMSEEKS